MDDLNEFDLSGIKKKLGIGKEKNDSSEKEQKIAKVLFDKWNVIQSESNVKPTLKNITKFLIRKGAEEEVISFVAKHLGLS